MDEHWLAYHKPNPRVKLRLFCFPYAGGGASIYRSWQSAFPSSIEICPVELPGRGTKLKQKPYTRLLPLVEAIGQGIHSYLDIQFAFFGHSMGALISFELTRFLRKKYHLRPSHLIVSGRRAPQFLNTNRRTYDLSDSEFIDQLRALNGTPQEVLENPELMQFVMPILRGDFELVQTYEYEPGLPLDIPITALGGLQDPDVEIEHLQGWQSQTDASFMLRMFTGDHFFLHTAQRSLLEMLASENRKLVETFIHREDRLLTNHSTAER